jgi:hypothetical protein
VAVVLGAILVIWSLLVVRKREAFAHAPANTVPGE